MNYCETQDENVVEEKGQTNECEGEQVSKGRKFHNIENKHRKFQEKWTDELFFTDNNSDPLC